MGMVADRLIDMASSSISVSPLPFLSPLPNNFNPLVIVASPKSITIRPLIISASNAGNAGFMTDDKKHLLERYGLHPSDLEPSKERRRREREKSGKRTRWPLQEDPKPPKPPPRTTHKLLQVLGGTARRRKLLSPKGMDVRPMMEVVRGATFDILQVAGGCPASLRPGRWLDLYSGTGSVGIEAISRGCSEVHFVEIDPWVVTEVLRPNLEWTGFLDVSVIHTVRVESFLEHAEQFPGKDGSFDYVSVTPPYTVVDYGVLMEQLSKSPLVGKDTFIVVEYPLGTAMLDSCGYLVKIADRRFGRTNLAIYGPTWSQKKRKSGIFTGGSIMQNAPFSVDSYVERSG